jgi:hypothetical protein
MRRPASPDFTGLLVSFAVRDLILPSRESWFQPRPLTRRPAAYRTRVGNWLCLRPLTRRSAAYRARLNEGMARFWDALLNLRV